MVSMLKHAANSLRRVWMKFKTLKNDEERVFAALKLIYMPKAYADDHVLLSVAGVGGISYRVMSLLV